MIKTSLNRVIQGNHYQFSLLGGQVAQYPVSIVSSLICCIFGELAYKRNKLSMIILFKHNQNNRMIIHRITHTSLHNEILTYYANLGRLYGVWNSLLFCLLEFMPFTEASSL